MERDKIYFKNVLILNDKIDDDGDKFKLNWFNLNHPKTEINVFLDIKDNKAESIGLSSNIEERNGEIRCDMQVFKSVIENNFKGNTVNLYPKPFGRILEKRKENGITIIEKFVITGIDLSPNPHACKDIPPISFSY